jgi:IgA-specific serine endopeptidase
MMSKAPVWYLGSEGEQSFLAERLGQELVCLNDLPLSVEEPPRLIVLDVSCASAFEALQQLTEDPEFVASPIAVLSQRRLGGVFAQALLGSADIRWVVQSPLETARIPESLGAILLPTPAESESLASDSALTEELEEELSQALSQLELLDQEAVEQKALLDTTSLSNKDLSEKVVNLEAEIDSLTQDQEAQKAEVLGLERSLSDARTAADHTQSQLESAQLKLEESAVEVGELAEKIEEYKGELEEGELAEKRAESLLEELKTQRNQAVEDQRLANHARMEAEAEVKEAETSYSEAQSARDEALSERDEALSARDEAQSARDEAQSARDKAIQDVETFEQAFEAAKLEANQAEEAAKASAAQNQKLLAETQSQLAETKDWAVEAEQQIAEVEERLGSLEAKLKGVQAELTQAQSEGKAHEQAAVDSRALAERLEAESLAAKTETEAANALVASAIESAENASAAAETAQAEVAQANLDIETAQNALSVALDQAAIRQNQILELEDLGLRSKQETEALQKAHDEQKSWAIDAEQRAAEMEEQGRLALDGRTQALAQVEEEKANSKAFQETAQGAQAQAEQARLEMERLQVTTEEAKSLATEAEQQRDAAESARGSAETLRDEAVAAQNKAALAAGLAAEETESKFAAEKSAHEDHLHALKTDLERAAQALQEKRQELEESQSNRSVEQAAALENQAELGRRIESLGLHVQEGESLLEAANNALTERGQANSELVTQVQDLQAAELALQARLSAAETSFSDSQAASASLKRTFEKEKADQAIQIKSLVDQLASTQTDLAEKTASESEISMQLVSSESALNQERSQVQSLSLKLAETLQEVDEQQQESARSLSRLQAAMSAIQGERDQAQAESEQWQGALTEQQTRLERVELEHTSALQRGIEEATERVLIAERAQSQARIDSAVAEAVEKAETSAKAEVGKRESELRATQGLNSELESLRNEAAGLRETREKLQRKLSSASMQLDDEKERVRSATKAGVVWSARREPPKDESLLGKLKSPFKKS